MYSIQGMKKFPCIAFATAVCLAGATAPRPAFAQSGNDILDAKIKATSLCAAAEQVMFSCKIGGRSLSVCLAGAETKRPQLSYRFGAKGKPADMEIPAASTSPRPDLFAAYPTHMGASGRWVRLGAKHGDVEYVVYLNQHKFDLPVQRAGVAVLKNGVQQAVLACTSDNYADEGISSLDTRPNLATLTPYPKSLDDDLVSLPDIAWTPCGELNKRDWKRYCGPATEAF